MSFGDQNPGLGSDSDVLSEYDSFVVGRSPNRFLFVIFFRNDGQLVFSDHLLISFQADP